MEVVHGGHTEAAGGCGAKQKARVSILVFGFWAKVSLGPG